MVSGHAKWSIWNPGIDPDQYALTTKAGYVYILSESFGLEQVQDPNGNTISYTNNGIIHSAGKSVLFARDGAGRITEIQDPAGNLISYTHDANGDLIAVTDRAFATTDMAYNNEHGLVDIIDPLGARVIRNIYDDDGRLVAQEDNLGNRTDFNHNLSGRESVVTDRLGRTTFLYYDERGNVTSEVNALGEISTYTYDENGNTLSEDDQGQLTLYSWNSENQLVEHMEHLSLSHMTHALVSDRRLITVVTLPFNTLKVNHRFSPLLPVLLVHGLFSLLLTLH